LSLHLFRFYVWPWDSDSTGKALVLISGTQFDSLIQDISRFSAKKKLKFNINLKKELFEDIGLVIHFPSHPRLQPRYLGQSTSRDEYNRLTNYVPPKTYRIPGEMAVPNPDDRSIKAFKAMVEEAIELNKNKNKAAKAKRQELRKLSNLQLTKQLKRTQRYLGLRPKRENGVCSPSDHVDIY
jgi:hypothetical protein